MLLTNPNALWGLLAIAIPILLHLFNLQRYRKVYFTNVRFLRQLQLEAKKQRRLRHWLALLSRVLAIAMLVMAFARPYLPPIHGYKAGSEEVVSIYIDNSFSMEAQGDAGRLLDEARQKAIGVVKGHPRAARFGLVTNDFDGRHHHLFTADEMLSLIEEVELSPSVRAISDVLQRQYDIVRTGNKEHASVYLLSDFQRNMAIADPAKTDTSLRHFFLPLTAGALQNLSIDTCWFAVPVQQPGQVAQLHVRITNHSTQQYEKIPVKLLINGIQRTLATADLDANSHHDLLMTFTIRETGLHNGVIEISDYPITFDDQLFFSFNVLPVIRVLSICDRQPSPYLRTLYGSDSLFQYQEVNLRQINYSTFSGQQLIILSGLSSISSGLANELSKFVNAGGHLVVIPTREAERASYNIFMESLQSVSFSTSDTSRTRLDQLDLLHPVYGDVFERDASGRYIMPPETDLPWVRYYWSLQMPSRRDVEVVVRLQNGQPFLVTNSVGEGTVWAMAAPLEKDATNFPVHALFVPTFYKMALLSAPRQALYHIIGRDESVLIGNITPDTEQVFHLRSSDEQFEFIPGHRVLNFRTWIYALNRIHIAGNYHLLAGQRILSALAFNYDRRESEQDYLSADQLSELAVKAGITNFAVIRNSDRPIDQVISEMNIGRQLWKYFIIAALFFLMLEGLALRFLS